jgi:hypothetical protein
MLRKTVITGQKNSTIGEKKMIKDPTTGRFVRPMSRMQELKEDFGIKNAACSPEEEGKRIKEMLAKLDKPIPSAKPVSDFFYKVEIGLVYGVLILAMLAVLPIAFCVYGHFFVDLFDYLNPVVGPVIKDWFS